MRQKLTDEEKRIKHNAKCKKYRDSHLEERRAYEREYARQYYLTHKEQKALTQLKYLQKKYGNVADDINSDSQNGDNSANV